MSSDVETSRGATAPLTPPSSSTAAVNQPRAARSFWERIQLRAFAPVDIASLVFFRIAFGALLTWEVCRYFQYGWIRRYWIEPEFLFKYYGFTWVHPLPGNGMYILWVALGVLAVFIALGFLYRVSVTLFLLGFAYSFLLEQANYLNHLYLVCLLAFLLIFIPAHRAFSIDAWLRPRIRSQTTPAWTLWLLRFQMGVVYFYGGVAKVSPDWLRGEPMRSWMAAKTDFPLIGRFFREEWAVYTITYGGLLLDLLIVPALLWRRTRVPAFILAVMFHLMNAQMFNIGIFPWLGIGATALFLSPSWPRRLIGFFRRSGSPNANAPASDAAWPRHAPLTLSLLGVYVAIQLLVPMRHLLYPGRADWTYEGHRFSWRMKLHDRDARARFYVIEQNIGGEAEVPPRAFLRRVQASKMAARPDMILQFAHFLARKIPQRGPKPLRVEARVLSSLNGRKPQLLIDQNVDLAAEPRTLRHARWILPLTEPLPTSPRKTRSKPAPSDSDEMSAE